MRATRVHQQSGVALHYELSGAEAGHRVLFIQGVGAAGEAWRPQVRDLEGEVRSLICDNRGVGRSQPCTGLISIEAMADDARALMDAAGWDSAHVVGHSMGGVIAQQLAFDCPTRVRSLSLLCTFARGKDAARPTPWVLWMTLRTRLGTRRMRRHAFLEMLVPKPELAGMDGDRVAAEVAALVGRDLADSPSILMRQLRALARHDGFARLGGLAGIPTLVISAEHDRIARREYGRELAKAIPGAVFEEIHGASHGVTIFHHAAISARLRRFFEAAESVSAARVGAV